MDEINRNSTSSLLQIQSQIDISGSILSPGRNLGMKGDGSSPCLLPKVVHGDEKELPVRGERIVKGGMVVQGATTAGEERNVEEEYKASITTSIMTRFGPTGAIGSHLREKQQQEVLVASKFSSPNRFDDLVEVDEESEEVSSREDSGNPNSYNPYQRHI
jgi:hypothetical protein